MIAAVLLACSACAAEQAGGPGAPTAAAEPGEAVARTVARAAARSVPAVTERLTVASAGIDQPLLPRGLSGDGTINPGAGELVWFTGHGRVAPGRRGTTVIAGHVSYQGAPDVFADLSKVRVGDEVRLRRSTGGERRYQVTDVDIVGKTELPLDDRVWGPHGRSSRLVLITCDDELGYRADGHRAANLVVIAAPAP